MVLKPPAIQDLISLVWDLKEITKLCLWGIGQFYDNYNDACHSCIVCRQYMLNVALKVQEELK